MNIYQLIKQFIKAKPVMRNTNNIAFIIGTGRCGTTMLAQILNAHSKICIPVELQLIFGYSGNGPRLYELFSTGEVLHWGAQDFIQKVEQLCPYRFEKFFDYEEFFHNQKYPLDNLSDLLTKLYNAVAKNNEKDIFIEQTPWYGQRLDIMKELFPHAKFIHMMRDGRDVALSFSRTPWWQKLPLDNLNQWQQEITKIHSDAKTLLTKNQYLEVKYEDFVAKPEKTLQIITSFLGIEFENGMLLPENLIDYYDNKFSKAVEAPISIASQAYEKWHAKKEQLVFSDNVYGWKKNNSELFLDISPEAKATLEKFGYN